MRIGGLNGVDAYFAAEDFGAISESAAIRACMSLHMFAVIDI